MIIDELVMGFDCREVGKPNLEIKNWTGDTSWLLNPNAQRILTVNRAFWPSIFFPKEVRRVPTGHLAIVDGASPFMFDTLDLTYNNYFMDVDIVRDVLSQRKDVIQYPHWIIAVAIVQTPIYVEVNAQNNLGVPPVMDQAPNAHWQRIGYDVEDSILFNGGLLIAWTGEHQVERREKWGRRLNENYLFDNQEDAVGYAEWHQHLNPGAGTQIVFGLYRVE